MVVVGSIGNCDGWSMHGMISSFDVQDVLPTEGISIIMSGTPQSYSCRLVHMYVSHRVTREMQALWGE